MKSHELLDAVGGIDGKFIENAAHRSPKRSAWKLAAPIAACLVLLAGVCLALPGLHSSNGTRFAPVPNPNGKTEWAELPKGSPSHPILRPGDEGYITPAPTLAPVPPADGITIPAIELPESSVSADMIGLVVYRGGIYTEARSYYGEAAQRIDPLVGERLGTATGTISEWSKQEEYAVEFASTVAGDIYTVNGYDPGFRICLRMEVEREDGQPELWIEFFDRLNGITIATGSDVFEDRLHIRGRVEAIRWQAHDDWNWNKGSLREADIPQDTWDAFLDALDQGGFIDAWTPGGAFYENRPGSSIYDTPNQAHLFLHMDDGTVIELRLIEGGYVRYNSFGSGWYFVKIPGEAFDAVYDACGGTHRKDW